MKTLKLSTLLAAASIALAAASSHANAVVIGTESQIDPFLNHIYHDVLGRAPDAAGEAGWHAALLGGMDTGTVAMDFLTSPEYQKDLVATFKNLDPALSVSSPGLGQFPLMEQVFTSAAYTSAHPTDLDYVESLYLNILGRGSDPAGKAGWVSVYDANPLNVLGIVDGFITSPEYKTALVTGYYKNLLRRAPDAPGLAGWVTSGFGTPESVEAGFIGSPEYLNVSVTSGVPELSTWAMMIIGFGGVGLQMRRRDRAVALSA